MKSNREQVLDLLRQCTGAVTAEENSGVPTQYLSKRLGMQRTNVSSILNSLVKEGLVEKIEGRPVLFRITQVNLKQGELSCFSEFIGHQGSMKRAVQLAKAAILYPQHSLHSLILGPSGAGKGSFAGLMYRFAVENGVLDEAAPYVKFNCAHYIDDPERMSAELFGMNQAENLCYMERAEDGILFIDNGELLSASMRNNLFQIIENNYMLVNGKQTNLHTTVICSLSDDASKSVLDMYKSQFSVTIHFQPLEERTLTERFEIIQRFFSHEAKQSKKTLVITSEILIGLLLYPCKGQLRQLKNDIKIACANAYVREYATQKSQIQIVMSDFPYYVRTGLLNYKKHRGDLKDIISEDTNYVFSAELEIKTQANTLSEPQGYSIYGWIEQKTMELQKRGISENDINTIVSIDIENEFKKYSSRLSQQVLNKEQLSQIVESKIIDLVNDFIGRAAKQFNRIYPMSVFFGLCLHLNATLNNGEHKQKLSNERIMEIVEKYKEEYAFSMKFVSLLEKEYSIRLSIDEVIFITMFICDKIIKDEDVERPVILIAMHGDQVASSVVDVVKSLSGSTIHAYDMPLDKKTQDAYEQLRELVVTINMGKGILVLYDMGSLKEMFEMIAVETGIVIKAIEIPLTVLALECSRKVLLEHDVNTVYQSVMERYKSLSFLNDNAYHRPRTAKVIITLCMSGEGGAIQTKKYLEKHLALADTEIVPLSISDRKLLIEEINRIHEKSEIICNIGTYDPQVMGIPFIPISQVFSCNPQSLSLLLNISEKHSVAFDENCEIILEHLGEELTNVDISKLRLVIPKVLADMEHFFDGVFTLDLKVGLLVHIACCVDRLIAGNATPIHIYKDEILGNNEQLCHKLKECFAPMEDMFGIEFFDNEYANIISIMRKSRHGAK